LRVDDYKNALALAAKDLIGRNQAEVAELAGAELSNSLLKFQFMNRDLVVTTATFTVAWADQSPEEEFALTDAVMILHYLQGAKGVRPTGEFIAYRQIKGGEFYTAAFNKRAEVPLIGTFGNKPGLLAKAAQALGGRPKEGIGDEASVFRVLPNIDIATIIHLGDEEFPPQGQVLFDRSISEALSIEDVAWLGSALVYRLMAAARKVG
jgi:hypothetical protein